MKEVFRSEIGAKTGQKQGKNKGKTGEKQGSARFCSLCEISQPLRNRHFAAKPVRSAIALSAKIFTAAKPFLAHECHFVAQEHPFRSCETHCEVVKPDFATKVPFRRVFRGCETTFWHMSAIWKPRTLILQLQNGCETSTP